MKQSIYLRETSLIYDHAKLTILPPTAATEPYQWGPKMYHYSTTFIYRVEVCLFFKN